MDLSELSGWDPNLSLQEHTANLLAMDDSTMAAMILHSDGLSLFRDMGLYNSVSTSLDISGIPKFPPPPQQPQLAQAPPRRGHNQSSSSDSHSTPSPGSVLFSPSPASQDMSLQSPELGLVGLTGNSRLASTSEADDILLANILGHPVRSVSANTSMVGLPDDLGFSPTTGMDLTITATSPATADSSASATAFPAASPIASPSVSTSSGPVTVGGTSAALAALTPDRINRLLSAAEAAAEGAATLVEDLLMVTEEPAQFARFRYMSEQRERSLAGENSFPTLMVNPKYARVVPEMALVTAVLVTKMPDPHTGRQQKHWHHLGGIPAAPLEGPQRIARFDNIAVIMDKANNKDKDKSKAPVRSKDDQRCVRIMFELVFVSGNTQFYGRAISQPIYNAKLAITKISHSSGPVTGGNEVIMLCSKIRKGVTGVRMTDPTQWSVQAPSGSAWELNPQTLKADCNVPGANLFFHHQYAVVLTLPPYHTQTITAPVTVRISILDTDDETESQYVEYTYLPAEAAVRNAELAARKRRRDDSMRDFMDRFDGSDGGNGSGSGRGNNGGHDGSDANNNGRGGGGGSSSSKGGDEPFNFNSLIPMHQHKLHQLALSTVRAVQGFAASGDARYLLALHRQLLAAPNENGDSPLHTAVAQGNLRSTMALLPLLAAEDLQSVNDMGETVLHSAVIEKRAAIARLLLVAGADLGQSNARNFNRNSLHYLARHGDRATAMAVFGVFGSAQAPPANTNTPAQAPAGETKPKPADLRLLARIQAQAIKALLACELETGATPAHLAIRGGHWHVFEACAKLAASAPIPKAAGSLLSMVAEKSSGHSLLHSCVLANNEQAVRLLINLGASGNARDFGKNTPLHLAARQGHIGIAALLVEAGATLSLNAVSQTPLDVLTSEGSGLSRDQLRALVAVLRGELKYADMRGRPTLRMPTHAELHSTAAALTSASPGAVSLADFYAGKKASRSPAPLGASSSLLSSTGASAAGASAPTIAAVHAASATPVERTSMNNDDDYVLLEKDAPYPVEQQPHGKRNKHSHHRFTRSSHGSQDKDELKKDKDDPKKEKEPKELSKFTLKEAFVDGTNFWELTRKFAGKKKMASASTGEMEPLSPERPLSPTNAGSGAASPFNQAKEQVSPGAVPPTGLEKLVNKLMDASEATLSSQPAEAVTPEQKLAEKLEKLGLAPASTTSAPPPHPKVAALNAQSVEDARKTSTHALYSVD
ncbi:hypothetical protein CAOG_01632 [Capsaspora owczarzaki ATCC 30864]|uniref:IPT/TIG domain-containing protein n=2 Tax=Capsaspora owczarzaki TaxID=192875 RepID=A0A0D2WKT4_CAPO3|nr:hypothetical protein CAOG_01632 [Capsaspora owczarzaki ATCC 30864]ADX60055.1 NFkappaB [Capsaspora owczarzaki]KJE90298.1 hypothetical protein CAOG_001632 [Capsaspora owczarzaki ATCC 30864]KJE90299.1 hypothetical protein, variant [Capsaspora owczarzaki ATCC 30864]|eukprot:XP_004364500.1 hypothetical protein CAOG_01632 [Capsaspora owczarzaki ATCC 30864]